MPITGAVDALYDWGLLLRTAMPASHLPAMAVTYPADLRCSASPVMFCDMPVLSLHGLPRPVFTCTGRRPDWREVREGVQNLCT